MMSNLASAMDILGQLEEWYWTHGVKRLDSQEYALPPDWMADIYTIMRNIAHDQQRQHYPRPSIAIYGESQAGKSRVPATHAKRCNFYLFLTQHGDKKTEGNLSGLSLIINCQNLFLSDRLISSFFHFHWSMGLQLSWDARWRRWSQFIL